MKNKYSFKLQKQVNNLYTNNCVSNKIKKIRHTINKNQFLCNCKQFYLNNNDLMIKLAELNINTILDLDNYVDWIELYGEF
jgi:CYTH domain-containing protein